MHDDTLRLFWIEVTEEEAREEAITPAELALVQERRREGWHLAYRDFGRRPVDPAGERSVPVVFLGFSRD
jgi:hypothetical protein